MQHDSDLNLVSIRIRIRIIPLESEQNSKRGTFNPKWSQMQ